MDIQLARTFLVVAETRNFVRAADQLCVTQSTVSTRIKSLEDQLGRQLFVRNKSGVTLTKAGELFGRHAATLVQVWHHAKSEVEIPDGFAHVITIGARFGLWDPLLLKWLSEMNADHNDIAIRAELGMSDTLLKRMAEGTLDIAVVYSAKTMPALTAEPLFLERLVLVTTDADNKSILPANYVHVDWGEEFQRKFRLTFPDQMGHGIRVNLGVLGLEFIEQNGGAGYFPERLVRTKLNDRVLSLIPDAPVITFPVFVVFSTNNADQAMDLAIRKLRAIAKSLIGESVLLNSEN